MFLPRNDESCTIDTDASDTYIEVTPHLEQEYGSSRPVSYWPRTVKDKEQKLGTTHR